MVMDSAQYEEKVKDLLADPVYKKLKRNPTLATERRVLKEVREFEKKEVIPKTLSTGLKPTASRPPKLYGLPKIHKLHVSLRSVVSCIGSPTYHLSKYITFLIYPLAGQTTFC